MDMKKLLEAVTKFAGEPEQKPGDQVRGTDKAKTGSKQHPFKGKLVGDSKDNMLKGLSQVSEDKSLEWKLAEAFVNFNEDDIGVEPKRPARKGSRPSRPYTKNGKPSKRYTPVEEGWNTGNDRVSLPDTPHTYWSGTGALQKEYDVLYNELVPSQGKADTIEGEVLRASSKIVYRHYNDGDEFNEASFDQLTPYIGTVTSYDDLAHKAIEFALKANGNYTPNPDWDSLDVMDYGPAEEEEYDDEDEEDDWYDDEELEESDKEEFKSTYKKFNDKVKTQKEQPAEGRGDSKGLHKKVTIVKGRDAGKTGYVRQIKTDKLRNRVYLDLDLEDGGQAVVLKQDVRLVKEVDEARTTWNNDFYVYDPETKVVKKKFRTHRGAKQYAEANGLKVASAEYYHDTVSKEVDEDWKKNLGTAALGAALAFGGAKAANAGQGPEQAPQQAAAAATQQAQAQNPYHNDLGVLVGVAQSKGGMQVLGKILSADQIQQVKAAYAKAKADPNLAKSAQFKQGQQLGFELGNSYADSSSQQMTDLNKRGPSYAGILSPMVVKPGEARSAEDITKVNQANAGKLKQAVTAAYGNMMAGGLQEGWESGPEERTRVERDPDAEYDAMRQEKLDAPYAQKEPEAKGYHVVSLDTRQPVTDEVFPTKGHAMAYIQSNHSKNLAYRAINEGIESGDPVESAVLSAVQELIQQGHTEVAPEVITNMVVAATSQPFLLKDLVDANNNSPAIQHYVDSINPTKVKFSNEILTVKNEDPMKDKKQAQAGVSSMAARAASRNRLGEASTPLRDREDYQAKNKALQDIQMDPSTSQDPQLSAELARRKAELVQQAKQLGISESRAHKLIANKLKQMELQRQMGSPESDAAYAQHVDRLKKSSAEYVKNTPNTIYKREVEEAGSAIGGSATSSAANAPVATNTATTDAEPVDPAVAKNIATATSTLKTATGSTAPTTSIAKALDAASQGKGVSSTDMRVIEPLMKDLTTVAQDPKLANQFKTLASQVNQTQKLQQQVKK